jgi:hypothetical protein
MCHRHWFAVIVGNDHGRADMGDSEKQFGKLEG